MSLYLYNGVIHIHSTYSDGALSIPEIAASAAALKLDYMLMTDHNTLKPKFDGLEGYHSSVLVGIGMEINDPADTNHYLAFDIDEDFSELLPPGEYVRRVKEQGGFGFIAHPDENRSHLDAYPPYPWNLWDNQAFDGIEIWNQMSEWMEGLTSKNKFRRVLHPRRSILGPKQVTLQRWDELNLKRKVVGLGGVDAHGVNYKLWGLFRLIIFRYKVVFRTIRTHLLTLNKLHPENPANYKQDITTLYEALRHGRSFFSNHYLGDASAFRFYAVSADSEFQMGDTVPFLPDLRFIIKNPGQAVTRLLHNGQIIANFSAPEISYPVPSPGVYRVEVLREAQPWIFSNHIRIEDVR